MKLDVILNKFIEDHSEYLEYSLSKSYVKSELIDDARQYVVMNLITAYTKRFKYTDFFWVVKTIIRRKIIDFTNFQKKLSRGLLFENQFNVSTGSTGTHATDSTETVSIIDYLSEKFNPQNTKKTEGIIVIDYMRKLEERINDLSDIGVNFTEWDREYMEVVLELYDYDNEIDPDEISLCMGYTEEDRSEFNTRLMNMKAKVRRCIEDGEIETFNVEA